MALDLATLTFSAILPIWWIKFMYELPASAVLVAQITGIVLGFSIVIACYVALVILIVYTIKRDIIRKNYINSLNDEDKAVILTYQNLRVFKKK